MKQQPSSRSIPTTRIPSRGGLPPAAARRLSRPAAVLACSALLAGCGTTLPPQGAVEFPSTSPASRRIPGPVRTIVVDAGHGGHDPGTSHYGLKEKHLALDIARRLRGHLEAAGFRVLLTRDRDEFIALSGRPAVANRLGADLFISVHINANRNRRVSGIEVYYPRVSVVSSSAQWPPSVQPGEIAIPSMTVKQVLWDMVLRRTRSQSRRLASTICRAMRNGMQAPCRSTKPARFVVLREAWMPAVLVEVGYVSNQSEARRLGSAEYRELAAQAIAEGVVRYVRELGVEPI